MPSKNFLSNLSQQQKDLIVEKLHEYIENDYDINQKQMPCVYECLAKKVKKNTFDPEKSVKIFYNIVYRNRRTFIAHINTSPYWRIQLDDMNNIRYLETIMIQQIAELLNQDFLTHINNNPDEYGLI